MTIRIVNENGTAVVDMTFTDERDVDMIPITAFWQLQLRDGTIINEREFAEGSFADGISTELQIVLSGDDLAIDSSGDVNRVFAIKGTYNSDAGTGLTFAEEINFVIRNLYSQS